MKTQLSTLALGLSASGVLFAQQIPQAVHANLASTSIESISILGARTPINKRLVAGSISTITSEQIQASGALSLSDLLRTIPSVNIAQSGPLGALSELRFRGSESNHVLVMLDGVEINDLGQGGLIDLSHISLANIESIEVLRGPQSALWGSSAIGGIINIRSKRLGKEDALSGGAQVGYGNKNTAQLSANMTGHQNAWQYALSASSLHTDGENIARKGDEEDAYKNTSIFGKLGYDFSKHHRIKANMRLVDYRSDFDATDFSTGLTADADNHSDGEQLSFGVNWFYKQEDSLFSQTISYQYSEQENVNYTSREFTGSTKGEKQRLLYNQHFTTPSGHINAGIEAVNEAFEQAGPVVFGDPNQRQTNRTLSLIGDTLHKINNIVSLSASARFDNNDEFDDATSYRIGANYQVSDRLRSFLSYGAAIKNPTFTERFGFFPGSFLGNLDLKPESSRSLELGLDYQSQYYQVQMSWYRARLEDEILGFVFDANTNLFTAQNAVNNSEREGFEVTLSQSQTRWQWSLSYAYLDASEASALGEKMTELRRARHTGSAWLSYDFSDSQALYLQADYTGTRFDRLFPPFPLPSQVIALDNYWLVSANYKLKINENNELSLRLSNAFNQAFEDVVGFSGESMRVFASYHYRW